MEPKEFLDVSSIKEARDAIKSHFIIKPRIEEVDLKNALGRVIARDLIAPIDVPPFDRASMDGYALKAKDTFYADEESPANLDLMGHISAGDNVGFTIEEGKCVGIATGAPIPKGANAVVMVEYTDKVREEGQDRVNIYRPVAPGENIMAAGKDIMRGEIVLRKGTNITPRETGVLASLGFQGVPVYRKLRVALISTGNEIIRPGDKLEFGKIYDVNSRALADSIKENGGEVEFLGIVKDDYPALLKKIQDILDEDYDMVIASGGTSAGTGDLLYKVIDDLGRPGVLVHGIAIKPGKPTIIASVKDKLIFGLPGYPTSALVIFDVFVAPIVRAMAGLTQIDRRTINARSAMRLYSAKGRHEYMLVNIIQGIHGSFSVYPILTGSGAITTLAEADGYIEIPEEKEMIGDGEGVKITMLSDNIKPADLYIIGSHCIGIDILLNIINQSSPVHAKTVHVGSSGGLAAVSRGESDISGTHLIDEKTGEYNLASLKRLGLLKKAYLIRGYDREQGLVIPEGNPKKIRGIGDLLRKDVAFMNRNSGSGTRVLLDMELKKIAKKEGNDMKKIIQDINGYEIEAKSHSAIAAAVAYGRADVGLAIKTVADQYGLYFIPIKDEKYDFAIPKEKINKPMVQKFLEALRSNDFKKELERTPGLNTNEETGSIIHPP